MSALNRRDVLGVGLLCTTTGLAYASRTRWSKDTSNSKAGDAAIDGIAGDGVTNDTEALTQAIAAAIKHNHALYLDKIYAISGLEIPGEEGNLRIIGDPVFVQAKPNLPCLSIKKQPLQQSVALHLRCTVIPHEMSKKADINNVAVNLTGFSSSNVEVKLGRASKHTVDTGRFNTVVYADSASPFHYGNTIKVIASAVPSPQYGIRYANGGKGVLGNPNINMLSGWFVSLDTNIGDVLIDVGDTTQTIISGPTLMEACPNAIGVKMGNFTTVRDTWFENVGSDLYLTKTSSITPNNCLVERCYFSGKDHRIYIDNNVIARPKFINCLGETELQYLTV